VRIFSPYRAHSSGWFIGTADAVQQNYGFIKTGNPDSLLILSGDHVYGMDYSAMVRFHEDNHADLTMATITVSMEEASRFGIVGVDANNRVKAFVEKPSNPPSNLANMGVYIFKREILDQALWEDHLSKESSHDFGKDILPSLVANGAKVFAFPYNGYWVDVGTVNSYWQAHMDLLQSPPPLDLYDRNWVIHTRTEERPPVKIQHGATVEDSFICDGCIIEQGAKVTHSFLSPGVHIHSGAVINESIVLTDTDIREKALITRSIIDKRAIIGEEAQVGEKTTDDLRIAMVGKKAVIPTNGVIRRGAMVFPDVIPSDFPTSVVGVGEYIQTRRLPNEI